MIRNNILKGILCVLYCIVVDTNMVASDTFSKYPLRTIPYKYE